MDIDPDTMAVRGPTTRQLPDLTSDAGSADYNSADYNSSDLSEIATKGNRRSVPFHQLPVFSRLLVGVPVICALTLMLAGTARAVLWLFGVDT